MNYEKLAKCNPTFLQDNFFSIVPKYWQVSKYTVMLSEFSFTKKRKKVSLIFEWYIYIMVEPRILQNYGKLYIWTSELSQLKALQSNLFKWPPLSNYHCGVCPSKLPFNHYYLMRPATTFLTHKWKKKKKNCQKH